LGVSMSLETEQALRINIINVSPLMYFFMSLFI